MKVLSCVMVRCSDMVHDCCGGQVSSRACEGVCGHNGLERSRFFALAPRGCKPLAHALLAAGAIFPGSVAAEHTGLRHPNAHVLIAKTRPARDKPGRVLRSQKDASHVNGLTRGGQV